MTQLIDFILHIDKHLVDLIAQYGTWIYVILFLIIFAETGFVVTPFLPGDSLLFAAGGMAAIGDLSLANLMLLLSLAAILGNVVNYAIGFYLGYPMLDRGMINKNYLDQTERYFQKYGAQTIIFSRFAPILRTIAPFIAGVGKMEYKKFLLYNIVGAFSWVILCLCAGFFLFNIPIVKNNFSLITLGIIGISLIPALLTFFKVKKQQ